MTEARVPRLPLEEAKAAADEAGIPDYMAELSIFQVLLNHPTLARVVNDLLATMLWHGHLAPRLRELRQFHGLALPVRMRLRMDAALAGRLRAGCTGRRPARGEGLANP